MTTNWLTAALEAQKQMLDMQARQVRVFEDLTKAALAQTTANKALVQATEAQMKLFDNWTGLWGMKR